MKHRYKLLFMCLLVLILTGCSHSKSQAGYRAVTAVDIAFNHDDMQLTRHYTDSEKMESVLLYLRLTKPVSKAQALPPLSGDDIYQISVHLSDGETKYFYQAQHRYLLRPDRTWTLIDPGQASELYRLMRHYPSDAQL